MQDAHTCTMYTLNIDNSFLLRVIYTRAHTMWCRGLLLVVLSPPQSSPALLPTHTGQEGGWGAHTWGSTPLGGSRAPPLTGRLSRDRWCAGNAGHLGHRNWRNVYSANVRNSTTGLHAVELGVNDVGIQRMFTKFGAL